MKMKKRTILLLLGLCVALCLLPLTAAAAGDGTEETTFDVYIFDSEGNHTSLVGATIDLSQPLYIERSGGGMAQGGFCLWRCVNDAIPPNDLVSNADMSDGLYPLEYSNTSPVGSGINKIAGGFESGNATSGLSLHFRAGGENVFGYVPAGTYRFVSIYGGSVQYSPVFTITDNTGLSTLCTPTFYTGKTTQGEFTGPTAKLTNDATPLYLHMASFTPALTSNAASRILLLDTAASRQYLLWDNSHVNGALTDKKGDNVQILEGMTVEGWSMSGNDVSGNYAFPMAQSTYRLAVVVGGKTYVSPGVFTVANAPTPGSGPTITTTSLPNGVLQTEYSQTLAADAAAGGAITWSVSSGALPTGLSLAANTGLISGTPIAAGTYDFTVTATETGGGSATRELSIIVTKTPESVSWSAATLTLSTNRKGAAADYTFTMTPDESFTPAAGTKLTVAVPGVNLISYNSLSVTSPANVDLVVNGSAAILTFDGSATVDTTNGLVFSLANVTNPDVASITPAAAEVSYDTADKYVTLGAKDFNTITLSDWPTLTATVANWNAVKDMYLALRVTAQSAPDGPALTQYGLSSDSHSWPLPAWLEGQAATVTLLARDAAHRYQTIATEDIAAGVSAVSLTAGTAIVKPYTLAVIPAGATCDLKQNDGYLSPYNGKYWLASTTNLTAYGFVFANDLQRAQYSNSAPTIEVDGNVISVTLAEFNKEVTLSGMVTEAVEGGGTAPLAGVRVTATQTLGNDTTHSVSALTGADGSYSLNLYDGDARLTLSCYPYVRMDGDDPDTDNSLTVYSGTPTQNFVMKKAPSSLLSLNYSLDVDENDAATLNYLAHLNSASFTLRAQVGGATLANTFWGSLAGSQGGVYRLWSNEDAATLIDGNKTVTLTQSGGEMELVGEPSVTLDADNCGQADLRFQPRAGVVVELAADKNVSIGNYEARWFDASGAYVGSSDNRATINGDGRTVSFICPGAAGDYIVAFAPVAAATVATLTELDADIARRGVTIAAGKGVDLGKITLDSAATENALYITKPGSTLTSGYAQSGENSFFEITGTVGVDGNITDPTLTKLTFKTNGAALVNYVTVKFPGQVAATRYVPQSDGGNNSSYITFAEPISLDTPLNFVIYATEQGSDQELSITVTANISHSGGERTGQLIGQITEARQQPFISAPARSVDAEIAVSGFMPGASATSEIAIYDNGKLIGQGKSDSKGQWSAVVTLAGTMDDSPTAHSLTARWGDAESAAATVVHNAQGAALTRQGMYLDGSYYAADAAYIWYPRYESGGLSVVLEAEIENPDKLRSDYDYGAELDASIFAKPVVFSVQLSNGEIRFFEGEQVGNSGVFKTEEFIVNSPIIGTEVLYSSEDVFAKPDADGIMTRTENLSVCLENIAGAEEETHTQEQVNAAIDKLEATDDIIDVSVDNELSDAQKSLSAVELLKTQLTPVPDGQIAMYYTDREITEDVFTANMTYAKARQDAAAGSLTKTRLQDNGVTAYDVYRFVEQYDNTSFSLTLTVRYGAGGVVDGYYETSLLFTDSAAPFKEQPALRATRLTRGATRGGGAPISVGTVGSAILDGTGWIVTVVGDVETATGDAYTATQIGKVGNVFSAAGIVTTVGSGVSTNASYDQMLDESQNMLNSPCLKKLSPSLQAVVKNKINSHIKLIHDGKNMNFTVTAEGAVLGATSFLKLAPGWGTFIGFSSAVTNFGNSLSNDSMSQSISAEFSMMKDDVYRIYQKNVVDQGDDDIMNVEDCLRQSNPQRPKPSLDPSGVIYEAVLSNRVEDAVVTLYREDGGNKVMVDSGGDDILGARNPLLSDVYGYYEWFVPEGLWLVEAEKDGYEKNDSQSCVNIPAADKEDKNNITWLKVLPPQTEVHIGLVCKDAPYVKNIVATADGVEIEFSRYMDESTLIPAFGLTTAGGQDIPFTLEKLNSEESPTNPNVSYTSRIKLKTDELTEGAKLNISVGADVESYAGTTAGSVYANLLTVSEKYPLTVNGGTLSGGGTAGQFVAGASVTVIAAAPQAGRSFSSWQSDYSAVDGSADTVLTFTMPANPVSLTARYSGNALGVRNTAYDNTNTGAETPDPGNQGGGNGGSARTPKITANDGGTTKLSADGKNLTITPNTGYVIQDVLLNGQSQGPVTQLTGLKSTDKVQIIFAKAVTNPFLDVKTGDWFYQDVLDAVALGLINGKTATMYMPGDNMTLAEAVKLAACMNQLYNDGKVTLTNGSPIWYSTYAAYALEHGIIERNYNDAEYRQAVTRAEYAAIFAKALPTTALPAINDIPDNSLPDVKMTDSFAPSVYQLYRAGILKGNDAYGTFAPNSNIKRSEVAAIVVRMMDEDARVAAPSQLKK